MIPFDPLLERAIELASAWHSGTLRKGRWRDPAYNQADGTGAGVPVMAHLTTVALTVQRAGWPSPVVASAFLHDILEDPNQEGARMQPETLVDRMGTEVAALVEAVTEEMYDSGGRKRPWRARKEEYIEHLSSAPAEAVAISLADKLHNLWTINQSLEAGLPVFGGGAGHRGLSAGPAEQVWFFEALLVATADHTDERLEPIRRQLNEELERFRKRTQALG